MDNLTQVDNCIDRVFTNFNGEGQKYSPCGCGQTKEAMNDNQ